jgi:hypothetical protein
MRIAGRYRLPLISSPFGSAAHRPFSCLHGMTITARDRFASHVRANDLLGPKEHPNPADERRGEADPGYNSASLHVSAPVVRQADGTQL